MAFVLILVLLTGCKQSAPSPTPIEDAKPKWSASGVRVASFIAENDFDALVEGNRSVLKKDDLAPIAHVGLVTTAKAYEADFDANEIAAERKYANKKILLYGTVETINKDLFGDGYFSLGTSLFRGVQAHLAESAMDRAAEEKRGQTVALVCDPATRIASFAMTRNCLYLSQYMDQNHVSVLDQVTGFFESGRPIPSALFMPAIFGYVIGGAPGAPKSCTETPSVQACDPTKWKKKDLQEPYAHATEQFQTKIKDLEHHLRKVSCANPSQEIAVSAKPNSDTCIELR